MKKITNFKEATSHTWRLLFCALVLLGLTGSYVNAQNISAYSFAQSSGTYKQAGAGAKLTTSGFYDDANFAAITIPFTFTYHGVAFTTVTCQQNGFAVLGSSSTGYSAICSGTANVLSPLNNDLYGNTANGADFSYATVGTTPNRVLTLQWSNWGIYSSAANEFSFQIKLYETSNKVQFVYQNGTALGSTTAYVGLTGASGSDFQGRTTTTNWAATTAAGSACGATCTVSSTVRPTNGLTFTWTSAGTVAAMAFSQTTGTYVPVEAAASYTSVSSTAASNYDDTNFGTYGMPFSFTYHGATYSNISFGPNGYAQLSTVSSSLGYSALCSYTDVLSPLNNDLYSLGSQAPLGRDAAYATIGTAPNRTFVVQWSQWGIYSSGLNEFSFQIRLQETSNTVSFVYGPSPGTGGTTAYVGLTGASTADFQGRTTGSDWSATTAASSACASTCSVSSTVRPANGLTFTWSPPTSTPCSGTPAPGTTVSSANPVCSGVAFTLSNSNAFTGITGLTYQWQSADDAGFSVNLANLGTTATYAATQTAAKYYRCQVTCGGNTGTSTPVLVNMNSASVCAVLCVGTANCAASDHITNVSFGTLNNNSGACLGSGGNSAYSDFRSTVAAPSVQQGANVSLTVHVSNGGTEHAAVWIDWDHSLTFDAGEFYDLNSGTLGTDWTFTTTLAVPYTALAGTTLMRARSQYSTSITSGQSCTSWTYGETEDYLVTVTLAPACSGTPAPGNTISSVANACSGTPITLSLQNTTVGSGVTFQWQTSPNGSTWTNGGGTSTNATYATTQSSATFYQCLVTCAGNTTASNSLQVGMNTFDNCYCSPTYSSGTSGCFYGVINNVTLNTLNHNPACLNAAPYVFSNAPTGSATTSLIPGQTYTLSVTSGYYNGIGVWIDFNQSGSYDASEYFDISGNNNSAGVIWTGTATVTVPLTAVAGLTGMRVSSAYYCCYPFPMSSTSACQSWTYGETEDYKVTVIPLPATPSTPIEIGVPNCSTGGNLDPNGTAPVGETWYWQSTSTGTSTAIPASGLYNILANGTYYLRSQNNTYLTWSTNSSSITVTDFPAGPADPTVTAPGGNPTCGAVTLVSSVAGGGSSNYWQGTNATGVSTSTLADDGSTNNTYAAAGNGNYYLRAQDNTTFCWSNPVAIAVTIYALPTAPVVGASPSTVCPGSPASLSAIAPSAPPTGYSVASTPFTPVSPLTTSLANAGPTGDEGTVIANLGFSFNFYGTAYTQVQIHTNGYIVFGSSNYAFGSYSPPAIPNTGNTNNWVGFWADLNASAGQITYETQGIAPNRKFIANYNSVPYYSATPYYAGQIVVYETTGAIDVFLGHTQTTNTNACGLENLTGTAGIAAPGENSGSWAVDNVAWHFAPIQAIGFLWTPNGTGSGIASGDELLANISASPTATTTYTMTLTEPAHGCQNSSTVTVNVAPVPAAPTGANVATTCGAGTVTLTATGTGGTLSWYNAATGGTLLGTGNTLSVNVIASDVPVYVSESNGTCSGPRGTITAVYTAPPAISAAGDVSSVCSGGSNSGPGGPNNNTVNLSVSSGYAYTSYTWSSDIGGFSATGTSAVATPSVSTVYSVSATDGVCTNVQTVSVSVADVPTISSVTATPSSICQGGNSQLIAAVSGGAGGAVPSGYCTPVMFASNPCNYIVSVSTTGGVTNFTNSTNSYNGTGASYFPASAVSQSLGSSFTLNVQTGGTCGIAYYNVWVDWDRDGTFSAAEQIVTANGVNSANNLTSFTVNVPVTASPGGTRMRILADGNSTNPVSACDNFSAFYSEVEDYVLNIQGGLGFTFSWTGAGLDNNSIFNPIATLGSASEVYNVTVTEPSGCFASGTVTLSEPTANPGNTVSTVNPVCPTTMFTLSSQNSSPGAFYQWQSSPDGSNWTDISGATGATYTTSQSTDTYYRVSVGCASGGNFTTGLLVAENSVLNCYCNAGATTIGCTSGDEYVGNFQFNTINNTSACPASGQYTNFTNINTTVDQGLTYTASVLIPNWFSGDQAAVWIDFNQDGVLSDVTEKFALTTGGGSGAAPLTGDVTIPTTAMAGTTLMRVRGAYTGTVSSCGTVTYGEVEDYIVNIGIPAATSTATVCEGGTISLSAMPNNATSYTWTGPNGYLASGQNVSLTASLASDGVYTCTIVMSGNSYPVTTTTSVISSSFAPTALNSSVPSVCNGNSATISQTGGSLGAGAFWQWYDDNNIAVGSPINSDQTASLVVSPSATTTYHVRAEGGTAPCAATVENTGLTVTVVVNPTPSVTATPSSTSTCSGTAPSISLTGGDTYSWTGTPDAGTTIGTGNMGDPSSGTSATISEVLTNSSNSTAGQVVYSVSTVSADGCPSASNTLVTVDVNPLPIGSLTDANNQTISGETFCSGGSTDLHLGSTISGTSFTWSRIISAVTTTGSANPIQETITNPGTSDLIAVYTITPSANGCSGDAFSAIETIEAKPISNSATAAACAGDALSFSLSSSLGANTGYTWNASGPGSISGYNPSGSASGTNAAIVDGPFVNNSGLNGIVTYTVSPYALTGTLGCAGDDFTVDVTVGSIPASPGAIVGPSVICQLTTATYSVASVPNTTSYIWTVPGAVTNGVYQGMTILSGQGTNTITVSITSGTIIGALTCTSINGCVSGLHPANAPASLTITKKPGVPGAINGLTSVCGVGSTTYSIAPVFGATSYAWTLPTGMTIVGPATGTSITVNIATTYSYGQVKVSAVNACGNIPGTALVVYGTPVAPVAISGPLNVCGMSSATYVSSASTGAISYSWVVPAGMTIVGPSNGTTINVSIVGNVSGTLKVRANSPCASSTYRAITLVTTAPATAAITGPSAICGLTTATYSIPAVAGAVGYVWTLSTGLTGSSTGTSITVTIAASVVNGTVKVQTVNACGSLGIQTNKNLSRAVVPGAITGATTACIASNQTYSVVQQTGVTYSWSVTGGTISGNNNGTTVHVIWGAIAGPWSLQVVGTTTACAITSTKSLAVTVTSCPSPITVDNNTVEQKAASFNLYPNPTSDDFTMDVTSEMDQDLVIEVYDVLGNKVISEQHSVTTGVTSLKTNIESFRNGMYFVRVVDMDSNTLYTQTVTKQ